MNDALYDNSEGGVDDYLSGGDSAFVEADIARVYHQKSLLTLILDYMVLNFSK